jgi:isocitrate dehydrogenase
VAKIKMTTPLVEIDGDEMTRVLWQLVKEKLISPFVELNTEYYDLSIKNRDATNDKVTVDSANAILKYGVGVKCATITSNVARKTEYNLKELYPSPNATIRSILDGTVFRKPITVNCIKPAVKTWTKPIIIARHAYGDVYKNAEMLVPDGGKVELVVTQNDGSEKRILVANMKSGGIVQGMHNLDDSIKSFARCCFHLAEDEKLPLWFAAKDTISKIYDGRFKEIFNQIHDAEYKNVDYTYSLIDDAVAKIVRCNGGVVWACKNYDGDVMSDMVASASGSLAMMTSVLVSPSGSYEFEAAHGTVQRHYYRFQKGEKTSTNPTALIFAWTGALYKRGALDANSALCDFAKQLEAKTISTIESGKMTQDLALVSGETKAALNSWEFIDAIGANGA